MEQGLERDFFGFRCVENGNNWCHCVAWWVPTWEGWDKRSEAENRALREKLFSKGEYDGYLLYVDEKVAGWCQVGLRDRLEKLVAQRGVSASPDTWAISCIEIAPEFRGRGLAKRFLAEVIADLKVRGVKHLQAFPRRGTGLDAGAVWTGPESLYLDAGFTVEKDHARFPVLGLRLA